MKVEMNMAKRSLLEHIIEKINTVYKYTLELEIIEGEGVILPYGINYKTSSGYIVATKGFKTLEEVYIYLRGVRDILEI